VVQQAVCWLPPHTFIAQGLQESWPKLSARPRRNLLGDLSDSGFAFTWYAGRRAHRAYGATFDMCTKGCNKQAAGSKGPPNTTTKACLAHCPTAARQVDIQVSARAAARVNCQLPVQCRAGWGTRPALQAGDQGVPSECKLALVPTHALGSNPS
jgi:hypothetical protein